MSLLWLTSAAVAYAIGGLFMKASHGAANGRPTAMFLALFAAGALAQARGMRDADLSTSYVLVLGIEALAAVALGTVYLHEPLGASRVAAILLVVVGVAWLRLL